MNKYLLFDLDGTLLPMDTYAFVEQYVKAAAQYASHVVEPEVFVQRLVASSYAMINSEDTSLTNQEKFIADFFAQMEQEPDELMPVFDQFYQERYPALRSFTQPDPVARRMVELALARGFRLVLATNPVFPRTAIEQRMQWADVADLPWELVTSYEDFYSCKPNPRYYAEILQRIGAKPEDCIHIGNDMEEDMAATAIGIPVVIIDDYLINPHDKPLTDCLYSGSLQAVAAWMEEKEQL